MWTFPCRAANRADALSSPARMAVTYQSLCLVHKGASYQSWAQLPIGVSSWGLTSNVSVGVLLENAARHKCCGKGLTNSASWTESDLAQKGLKGLTESLEEGIRRGSHAWEGQRWQQRTWKDMSMVLEFRRSWEGRTWCRDVARGKGRTMLLKAGGFWMWKRQRPEEKGMVFKGYVRLWVQEREPKK